MIKWPKILWRKMLFLKEGAIEKRFSYVFMLRKANNVTQHFMVFKKIFLKRQGVIYLEHTVDSSFLE